MLAKAVALCYTHSVATRYPLAFLLLAGLLLPACESVRTVYDEGGNEVKPNESEGATESDLFAAYEKRFNESFSEKRNEQGVPEATSRRVSSFQKELDNAREADTPFASKSYDGVKESNIGGKTYAGTKLYDASKTYEGSGVRSSITQDMKPDFMNENRGIAHRDYTGGISERNKYEGTYTDDAGHSYGTHASQYRREQESGYFESHRHDTPAPPIYDHRSAQSKEIMNIRNILGRDKTDAEE